MRTATIAAALIALAACGGDDGPSLTEPHQIDLAACNSTAAPLAGGWVTEHWGCIGRESPNGAIDCDPAALPWFDGQEIDLAPLGVETFTFTIGAESGTAQPSGDASVSVDLASGSIQFATCADKRALVWFSSRTTDDFAAYAHRR